MVSLVLKQTLSNKSWQLCILVKYFLFFLSWTATVKPILKHAGEFSKGQIRDQIQHEIWCKEDFKVIPYVEIIQENC
jgi:hypothetical protein